MPEDRRHGDRREHDRREDDARIGEIGRTVERLEHSLENWQREMRETIDALRKDVSTRHHTVVDQLTKVVGPLSVHESQLATHKEQIGELEDEMKAARRNAAFISGGISILGFLLNVMGLPWKKP